MSFFEKIRWWFRKRWGKTIIDKIRRAMRDYFRKYGKWPTKIYLTIDNDFEFLELVCMGKKGIDKLGQPLFRDMFTYGTKFLEKGLFGMKVIERADEFKVE